MTKFNLYVIRDGVEVLSKSYVVKAGALRAYDRACVTFGAGANKPKATGIVALGTSAEQLKRTEWKQGFGWY